MRYRIFDFEVESDIDFPELAAGSESPRLELRRNVRPPRGDLVTWVHQLSRPDETAWLRVGRSPGELVLDFCGRAVLHYRDGVIHWQRDARTGDAAFRHVVLDQAIPLLVAHEGRVVLHATCVSLNGRSIVFAGPAGVGKSTIGAAVAVQSGAGIGDDAALLECRDRSVFVQPAYSAVRLWPDARAALAYEGGRAVWEGSEKQQFQDLAVVAANAARLEHIYLLESADDGVEPAVCDLRGREALIALVRHAYVLDPGDRVRAAAHFSQLSAIAASVSVRRLSVPHRFDMLPRVVSLVEADLRAGVHA